MMTLTELDTLLKTHKVQAGKSLTKIHETIDLTNLNYYTREIDKELSAPEQFRDTARLGELKTALKVIVSQAYDITRADINKSNKYEKQKIKVRKNHETIIVPAIVELHETIQQFLSTDADALTGTDGSPYEYLAILSDRLLEVVEA